MDAVDSLPALSIGIIAVVAVISGPFGVVDLTPAHENCAGDVFPGDGNASVAVERAPTTGTLSQARFGASAYHLTVPPATVTVSDVAGRSTLTYKIRILDLSTELGSTTVLSPCTTGDHQLVIPDASFREEEIRQDSYDATLFVIYRGTEGGAEVDRQLLARNVTVEVAE